MMNVLRMAWRNVWRNRRRSMVTIAAMTLALSVELLYSGLVTGMFVDMENDVTEMESGDIQIMSPDYLDRPSLYTVVEDHEAILSRLHEAGYAATPRLMSGGLAAAGEMSAGVAFVGVDPVADTTVLRLHEAVAEGQWLDASDSEGVLVGRGLARTLDLSVGSEVLVLSQAADGSTANALFEVRGILMSVAAGLDRSAILMLEQTFRELMVLPEGAHKIIVSRPDDVELADAAVAVAGMSAGQKVMTWAQLNPILAQMLQGVRGMIVVVFVIVYVAVAILILNAMLMAVFERIREFGVLKAIGYSPGQVMSMMVIEGMLQATVALFAGLAISAIPMWYLQTYGIDVGSLAGISMVGMTMPPVWRGYYTLDVMLTPIILLFFIVFFAVLYPAIKAARIQPVDAMHHQ
ncbi:MAG: putative ABC transport system permease protein [Myxococcota bacterium]|jgi:putative ABC transport system permease protein